MDIKVRKLEFIQEFLKLQSEDVILHLENLLKLEKEIAIEPMSKEELHNRIDKSEADFDNNRFKTNSELISKYL
jgi:hypothetical protein